MNSLIDKTNSVGNLVGKIESNELEIKVDIIGSGARGKEGLSAYEIWLQEGNTGTELDFLNSLKGEKGDKGDKGDVASTIKWENVTEKPDLAEKKYVQTRAQNFVTNGNGLLKNNENFSSFRFDDTDTFNSLGSFVDASYNSTKFNDELIPVDIDCSYRLSLYVKANPFVGAKHSIGVAFFDGDGGDLGINKFIHKNLIITANWTRLVGIIKPTDFPSETRYIRLIFISNREVEGGSMWYTNITFMLDYALKSDIPTKLSELEVDIPIVNKVNEISPDESGSVVLFPENIGAETPEGSDLKAKQAETKAKEYTDRLLSVSPIEPLGSYWFQEL